jgi:hypothetical protein
VPAGTWYPGQAWPGYRVFNEPVVFAQPATFQGTTPATFQGGITSPAVATLSKGIASAGPLVTSPGTVATGGTVSNATGYDVMVYASATTGISSAKIGTAVVAGSVGAGFTASYYLYSGNTITLSYTGTLTWNWLAV